MNHLMTSELFEFVDNRLGKERAGQVASHLAECAHCRRRAELERSTRHIVQSEPLFKAPERLAALVMVNVAAPERDPLVLRLLSKLGSFVAMIVVLAVVGLAIVKVSGANEQPDKTSSSIIQVVAPFSEAYAKGMESFIDRTTTITQAMETKAGAQFWKTVFIVLLTIGVLVAADRVFGKRFIKLRS
jgi:anti-sigma factor RsiW